MLNTVVDIRDFGAIGDGVADDAPAIQKALDGGHRTVHIPAGIWRVAATLLVDSYTTIQAAPQARLIMCGETPHTAKDFLLTNRDHHFGNANITIRGGIWDGNKKGRTNFKDPDLFNTAACTGSTLNFRNVHQLVLEDLTVANSVVYFIRMCMLDGFEIRHIRFESDPIENNQDGLHFNGWCRHGIVEDIRAVTVGETNDDLIALNADDSMKRLENTGMVCGPIEDITFKDLYAQDCHTVIRMLSVYSPIRNIRIQNVEAGCRCYALNCDGARYCRTPLVDDDLFPNGVGCIENVTIENFTTWYSQPAQQKGMMALESLPQNLQLVNFHRDMSKDQSPHIPTFTVEHIPGTRIESRRNGQIVEEHTLVDGKKLSLNQEFDYLKASL